MRAPKNGSPARFVLLLALAALLCRCRGERVGLACDSSLDCGSSETCAASHTCVAQTSSTGGASGSGGAAASTGGSRLNPTSGGSQSAGGVTSDAGPTGGIADAAGDADAAGTGGDPGAGGSNGTPDSILGAHCSGCSASPTGAPHWKPTGAVMSVGTFGTLANATELSWLNELLYPNHSVFIQDELIGPSRPHTAPYDDEFYTQLVANTHRVTQSFSSAEFTPPAGVMFMVVIVPTAEAANGSSFDFESGPIIPNALFPIRLTVGLNRNGESFEPSSYQDMPGYDHYTQPIADDGPSHLLLAYGANSSYGSGEPAAGAYQFTLTITDSSGAGWELQVPFTVTD